MRLAYFSPLNPQRSGISDYSEELLPHLSAAGARLTLFVDGFRPTNGDILSAFDVRDYRRDPEALAALEAPGAAAEFDAAVYHLGNDHRYHAGILGASRRRPGVVVLHDFALQDFFLGLARERRDPALYLEEVEACHGPEARREAEESLARGAEPPLLARPADFPLNRRIARSAEGLVVHSEWARARLERIAPGVPVVRIPMPAVVRGGSAAAGGKAPLEGREDGEGHEVRIANFGLITPGKGIEHALRALSRLKDRRRFRYTLVGEPNEFYDVRSLVRRYGMEDRVEITGHVTLEEFERRIRETDIALNLRERTVGETSASLCRVMAAGVCAVVADAGWYSELPSSCVVKVDLDETTDALLEAYLERLIADAPLRRRVGANARRHALSEHAVERSAALYLDFIRDLVATRARRHFLAGVGRELALLGVGPDAESFTRRLAADLADLAPTVAFEIDGRGTGDASTAAAALNGVASPKESPNGDAPASAPADNDATPAAPADGDVMTAAPADANTTRAAPADGDAPQSVPPFLPPFASPPLPSTPAPGGRLPKLEGLDYKRAAVEYPGRLDEERRHYLLTKPFYNLANKPVWQKGDGMDAETHRHFCDFANVASSLALPAGARLLDVGCGSGWLSEYFARLGYDALGIDISPDLVGMARERTSRVPYGVDHETPLRCEFRVHDIEAAPLSEKFDAVVCYDSLHHFEDERAVVRHLAAMLDVGGQLFILEGARPPEGSETEELLRSVMEEFSTLESPFDEDYLRALLDAEGLAVVGDYVSVNGLFEREMLEGDRLPLETLATDYHYLTCKKVCEGAPASTVPDSRRPSVLRASFALREAPRTTLRPGELLTVPLAVSNEGDTLWLTGRTVRAGIVMPAARVFEAGGAPVAEFHGQPLLPRAVAPGETVGFDVDYRVPRRAGTYRLVLDMVAQHVCWFGERGSEPLVVVFEVSEDAA
ncbi:MAG TPA: methyltransferase domain-containing protein [Pyrinomonadaceae bacterium]|nr:methyltransferase domain-containing protein [Pyrinomonadaceae bacterium]